MPDIEQDAKAVTRPIFKFLTGKSFIPVLFIIQLFILINGDQFFQISPSHTMAYMILPWGLMGLFYFTGDLKYSDMVDMTDRKDPISDWLRGGHNNIYGRSFEIQLIWAMFGFLTTWFILLIAFTTFNWPEPGLIMQTQATRLIIYNIVLVSVSETMAFVCILPIVLGKAKISDPRIKTLYRYGISQGMFAIFHVSAYWGAPNFGGAILMSFIFGSMFLAIADHKRGGLAPAMGVHACWNLWVLGAISGIYLGV